MTLSTTAVLPVTATKMQSIVQTVKYVFMVWLRENNEFCQPEDIAPKESNNCIARTLLGVRKVEKGIKDRDMSLKC
jgi:hypothetical protein